jgi:2,4-dienoyl-CoA reductase-like NADH-dependent reductase (Old Yellow Enzyme family)
MPTLFDTLRIDLGSQPHFPGAATRNRSTGPGLVPNALMRDYYVQRASAGLILSEATSVAPAGVGYPHTPGVWSDEQVEGWRSVVKGVHGAGGRIFLQLWHVGRISDPVYHDSALPVGLSAIAPKGNVSLIRPQRPYVAPRALKTEACGLVVEAYRPRTPRRPASTASRSTARTAICSTSFCRTAQNKRDDGYGGSLEIAPASCSK